MLHHGIIDTSSVIGQVESTHASVLDDKGNFVVRENWNAATTSSGPWTSICSGMSPIVPVKIITDYSRMSSEYFRVNIDWGSVGAARELSSNPKGTLLR